jgi:glycosyltransferase involved in cell wall biosynthesis
MKLLFVVDGRSPIALNWIRYFVAGGYDVYLASTYPCSPDLSPASLTIIPVALSEAAGQPASAFGRGWLRRLIPLGWRTALRQRLGPLTLPGAARRLRQLVEAWQPDLVHAMRLPYEGMLAARALEGLPTPLLVSVWGNDFTLHAPATPWLGRETRRALSRTDALHADCQRDVRLAHEWGFPKDRPAVVLPGAGGVQPELFYPPENPEGRQPLVVNPRGLRAYIRNDTFFRAVPLVLARRPETRFVCPAMAGEAEPQRWLNELGTGAQVELLPVQTRSQMADLFRRAQVAVSPSTHDGTPNTLLEAMACGCFPVAGDIESLREWIEPGANGLLVDPGDPQALAGAILQALGQPDLRRRAAEQNARLIAEKAGYGRVMQSAEKFYAEIAKK